MISDSQTLNSARSVVCSSKETKFIKGKIKKEIFKELRITKIFE